ncbi:MAG: glutaredoxin family protein [Rhodoferax sp.]|nr:glutaredoxin family protein [Rhodoferax sp.]
MKHCIQLFSQRTALAGLLCLFCLAVAQAQTVYRSVGADGKISFSDKPPDSAAQGKVPVGNTGSSATPTATPPATASTSLPFELRQVISKHPVTLYTTPDCAPCSSGRKLLTGRGIPFTERSVSSAEDISALQRLTGASSLPFLTIGGQHLKGFSESEWGLYLDAAGYPRKSALPAAWRNPAATPLVAVQKPLATPAEDKPTVRTEAPAPTTTSSPANPTGIQF